MGGGGGSNKGRKEDQGSQGWHVHCTTVVYIEGGVTMKERVGVFTIRRVKD